MSDWRITRDAVLLTLENSRAAAVRAEAASALCDLADDVPPADAGEYAAVIPRLLADKQTEVICAGLALGSLLLPKQEAIDLQVRHLGHSVDRVRVEAAGRLADFAEPTCRGALAAALQDSSSAVRFEAARGMAELKHAAGFDVLVAALDDAELRFRAASALARLGKPEAVPAMKKVFAQWVLPAFDRTQLAGALAHLGDPEGLAHVLKRATKKRWSMDRAMAVELLGDIAAPEAKALLMKIMSDVEDSDRGVAARALGRHKDDSVLPMYGSIAKEPHISDELRLDLAWGLSFLGSPAARELRSQISVTAAEAKIEMAELLSEFP